jgi:lipoprotein signal peptidase
MRSVKHWLVFISLLIIDQSSKLLAHLEGMVVLNPGVSFGLLFQIPSQILSYGLLLVLLIGFFAWFKFMPKQKWPAVWFFAGGMSNVVDRLLVGAVRDWLYVPIIGNRNNLADWFIVIGVVLVVIGSFKEGANAK